MKLWKLFLRTMKIMGKRCIIYFTAIFLMSTTWAMFSVMSSLLVKSVIDAAQTGNTSQMLQIIVLNVIVGIILLIVYRNATITYNVEAKRACGKLYSLLFRNAVRLPYSYYETHHSGEIMSKISYDVEKMASIYGSRFRRMVAPLLQVIVFVIPMFILSWKITLCLIGVNLVMLLINTLLVEPMGKVSKELSFINKTMTEKLSNLLQGMEQARMYSSGKNTVDEFMEENEKYAKQSNKRIMYIGCLEGCNGGFDLLCALTFLILGVYFVQEGHTTLGAITAIYTLYNGFSYQFLQLGRYIPEFVGCLVNAENIFNFIDEEKEPDSWYVTEEKNSSENFMDISNIEFYYSEDKPLIKDYSLYINKGESIAVTGHSGCGKTTLSKLLLSLYPIINGDISIEGKSYKNISNSDIRKLIAYVPQEPYLFNESIKENIRIGKLDATDEEIVQAAKLAYAHDFIQDLENGYDTYAGERGNKLSGGQRQRIAIARAILKDAPIVLLDEATSALDNESERLVNEALKSMKNNKTIIMIAHRPSTIALADRVENFK